VATEFYWLKIHPKARSKGHLSILVEVPSVYIAFVPYHPTVCETQTLFHHDPFLFATQQGMG